MVPALDQTPKSHQYPPAEPASRGPEPNGSGASRTAPDAPEPVAIALHQERDGESNPRVVATGRGALAEQILQIAFERGVKVRADADLTEILAAVELDSEVPLEALEAVAEILSYVYRANGRAGASATPAPNPAPTSDEESR